MSILLYEKIMQMTTQHKGNYSLMFKLELDANILRFKYHNAVLFNVGDETFQVHTSYKAGVKKEVR
jgi:hypothetical protein